MKGIKETSIIMSGNHPKLVIDKLKTMTRRTWGLEEVNKNPDDWEFKRINDGGIALFWRKNIMEEDIALCKCPYGQVGDRLWVRETWATEWMLNDFKPSELPKYSPYNPNELLPIAFTDTDWSGYRVGKTRPSIFLPRVHSRLTLEITGLRAERLLEITEGDAIAEGSYSIEEYIKKFIKLNHLPEDANPWNWVIGW